MEKTEKLTNRLREVRRQRGRRQADLAGEVGITRQTIIAIEKGKLNPSVTICLKLAKALQESVESLFSLESMTEMPQPVTGEGRAAGEQSVPSAAATSPVSSPVAEGVVEEVVETPFQFMAEPAEHAMEERVEEPSRETLDEGEDETTAHAIWDFV